MTDTVDLAGAQAVLDDLGPEAQARLDEAQAKHAQELAALGAVDAYALGGSAVYVAATIRANGYEVLVGGGGATSGGGTVGDVVLGNLFGSSLYAQFPGRNERGYFLTDHIEDVAVGADPWGSRDSDALGEAIRRAG